MLSELTKKGILAIKGLLDECKAGIEQTNKDLEVIDEKYRKLIAEEKKTLKSNLAEYKVQMKQYEKMISSFDATAVKEVLGDFESTATEEPESVAESTATEEDEGTVFDSMFPDNNEEEEEKEEEKEAVPVFAEEKNGMTTEDIISELEAAGLKPAENIAILDLNDDGVWVNTAEENKKKEVPTLEDGEDGWPEFPEDWK